MANKNKSLKKNSFYFLTYIKNHSTVTNNYMGYVISRSSIIIAFKGMSFILISVFTVFIQYNILDIIIVIRLTIYA